MAANKWWPFARLKNLLCGLKEPEDLAAQSKWNNQVRHNDWCCFLFSLLILFTSIHTDVSWHVTQLPVFINVIVIINLLVQDKQKRIKIYIIMDINELVFLDCGDPAKTTEDQKERNNAVFYFCLSNLVPVVQYYQNFHDVQNRDSGLRESGVFFISCVSGTIYSEYEFRSGQKFIKIFVHNLAFLLF